jgi:hypothetical protein
MDSIRNESNTKMVNGVEIPNISYLLMPYHAISHTQ